MRCKDIMKTEVECLSTEDTVVDAAKQMRDERVGFLPICDADNKVVGTITDRDFVLRVLAEEQPPTRQIQGVMTQEVVACRPDDDLQIAQSLMAKHHKSRIMCVDDEGRLMGVISLSDISQQPGDGASTTLRQVSEREVRA